MAISFDGATKRITLSAGTTTLDVRDLWSRWVDWLLTSDNSKYAIAMSELGGDDIDPSAGTIVPVYVFLQNGWKIKPQEANHTLAVTNGILLVSGGGDPFVNTTGNYVVRINYQQPVQAISFSSGGGGSAPTVNQIVDGIFSRVVEGSMTFEEMKRIELAVLAGKMNQSPSGTLHFRDLADTKDRATVVVVSGERTSVTLDGA